MSAVGSKPSFVAVLLVTLLVGGTFFAIQPIVYSNDTGGYLEGARFFLHMPGAKYAYWRTPLFPLLLDATGMGQLKTLYGVVAVQFMFAVAMPLLVYFSTAWINARLAATLGIIAALSLIPFVNDTYIMPNQFYAFFVVAAVFFTCRFIAARRRADIYAVALSTFLAVMVRPQGSYLFIVLLTIMAIAEPRQWKHCTVAFVVVAGMQFAYMGVRPYFAGPIAPSGEVLLSDLSHPGLPDDQELYGRALLFVRQNLVDEAAVIARFIDDQSLAQKVRLAAILQSLLNRDAPLAAQKALAADDPQVKDQALFYIAWDREAAGDAATAQSLRDQIGDAALRNKLAAVWARPVEIPVLTKDAPPDGQIEPRHYVTGLDMTNTSGKLLVFPTLLAKELDPDALIVPENGPMTARLYHVLDTYFGTGNILKTLYPGLAHYISAGDDPARVLLTQVPAVEAHWTLWGVLDRLYGPAEADKFMRSIYFEFASHHALTLGKLYGGMMLQGLIGRTVLSFAGAALELPSHPLIVTAPRFAQEIVASRARIADYEALGVIFARYFWIFILSVSVLAASGLVFVRDRDLLLVWATSWLVALHQLAVCAITSGTYFAYLFFVYIFLLIAAGISVYSAFLKVGRLSVRLRQKAANFS